LEKSGWPGVLVGRQRKKNWKMKMGGGLGCKGTRAKKMKKEREYSRAANYIGSNGNLGFGLFISDLNQGFWFQNKKVQTFSN
jgi:hypothetical protein